MGIKKKDTPENIAYWKFVEETAERVRRERPAWVDGEPCEEIDRSSIGDCVRSGGSSKREGT